MYLPQPPVVNFNETLNIKSVRDIVDMNVTEYARGLVQHEMYYLSQYVLYGSLSPGSLLDRVVRSGQSPINLVINPWQRSICRKILVYTGI